MKINALSASVVSLMLCFVSCGDIPEALSVVPYPQEVVFEGGTFNARGADVSAEGLTEDEMAFVEDFSEKLNLSSDGRKGCGKIVFKRDETLAPEAYKLEIGRCKAVAYSSSYSGTVYAVRTLMQMLPFEVYSGTVVADRDSWKIPAVTVNDSPRFGYRGMHLDCSRHFFNTDDIKKLLDLMSFYKLNRFHWHLTDDHGWRAEIKKYPKLTEIGAYRNGTMIEHDMNSNDGVRYGGFYTQEQMRDIVSYAASLGIEVIPEIDLPAHLVSALAAYPHLGCTGGPYELMTVWDIAKDVLCVGKESSFEFLEDVLDEICEIFPYEYIHIGGDECPKVRWENCPRCQAKIRELGLKDTEEWSAEHYLQNYVTARVQKYLLGKGKKVIGWDEILEGKLEPGATIMSWRGTEGGIKAATNGFDAIMTPCDYCYFDYCQSDRPELEPVSIGHYVPVEKCYGYEPLDGIPEDKTKHILGLQANLWAEFIKTPAHVQYMLLPRLLAISEVQWSPSEVKDYERFKADVLEHQFPLLKSLGYTYCKVIED